MKQRARDLHLLELFISAFLVLMTLIIAEALSFLLNQIALLALLVCVLFFVFAYLYVTGKREAGRARFATLHMHLLFLAILCAVALFLFYTLSGFAGFAIPAATWLINSGLLLALFIPLFFLTFIAFYLHGEKRIGARQVGFMLALVLLVLLLYFASKFMAQNVTLNDEEFLILHAVNITLSGGDPYNVSVAQLLYNNVNLTGASVTTNGEVVGVMDYPALFFLSFLPFYFASQPTLHNLSTIDLPLQAVFFIFLLLIALAASLKKKYLAMPSVFLFVFFVLAVSSVLSIATYLMLALLLLAYRFVDSKYSWLVLGICLSLQEQLWLPVLFLIVHSANNRGIRRGIINLVGAVAVFVLANLYFIALSPSAYFGALFTPLNRMLLPSGTATAAFFLEKFYPLLLSSYPALFVIACAFLVLLFAYKNKKELVPLFSAAPFLFLQGALPSHFAFFFFFLAFAFFADGKSTSGMGVLEKFLKNNRMRLYALLALLVAGALYVSYASHVAYVNSFGLAIGNQTIHQDVANRTSVYRSVVVYNGMGVNSVYVYAAAYGMQAYQSAQNASLTAIRVPPFRIIGFYNQSLIGARPECATYECLVNTNILQLPANKGSENLTVRIPWVNGTYPMTHIDIVLYNGEYVYIANATQQATG